MTVLTRILGALVGIALLALVANAIFVEGNLPISSAGYYGPVMLPLLLYSAVAFIAYAIGGHTLLRKIAPGLSGKPKPPSPEEPQASSIESHGNHKP